MSKNKNNIVFKKKPQYWVEFGENGVAVPINQGDNTNANTNTPTTDGVLQTNNILTGNAVIPTNTNQTLNHGTSSSSSTQIIDDLQNYVTVESPMKEGDWELI